MSHKEFEKYLDWIDGSRNLFGKDKDGAIVHPGQILLNTYLKPQRLSQMELSRKLGCSSSRINSFVNGKSSASADLALDLAKLFEPPAEYWLAMQARYDLYQARKTR